MLDRKNIFGLWREYTTTQRNPSLFDEAFSEAPIPQKEEIIEYLEKGKFVIGTRGAAECRLIEGEMIPPKDCFTDGQFVWTSVYMRYIQENNLNPNRRFLEYLNNILFSFPQNIPDERIKEIEAVLNSGYL